jgi:D-erythro-7,8-dihydroneopterin triphosphate epimerase
MASLITVKIKNLRLRTIVGIFPEERENLQDVIINAAIRFDAGPAVATDQIGDTLDYKSLAKKIIQHVETSRFFLLEKLARSVLDLMMEDPRVKKASVEIDKPHALRFADSVSCTAEAERP